MTNTEDEQRVHPIILQNKQNLRHWFNADGNYIEMFDGIDGKTYAAIIEPKDWTPELWDLYEEEGIRISKPTPVENIHFPQRPEGL